MKNNFNATAELEIQDWLLERIQRTNFMLTDFMSVTLYAHPSASAAFQVTKEDLDHSRNNEQSLSILMNKPFLVLVPSLTKPDDWRCLVENKVRTAAVSALQGSMPAMGPVTRTHLFHHNRQYFQLLKDVLAMNVLAAPILGISIELADYLRATSIEKLEMAVHDIEFPLFRWRFSARRFWHDFTAGWISDESAAHYLMQSSPMRSGSLPFKNVWTSLRLKRSQNDAFAYAMMRQGCRASIAAELFNIAPTTTRTMYREIHGVSSPCGCLPTSLTWYVENPVNRVQATTYTWLYRCALAAGANIPEALIAANDIAHKLFGKKLRINPNRATHLTSVMAVDRRLTVLPCRTCDTQYVLSSSDLKIEFPNTFSCPVCTQSINPPATDSKRKRKNPA